MSKTALCVFGAAIAIALLHPLLRADAAMVSGVYISADGKPLAGNQLHFENRITGDIYLTRTDADGSFSTDVPPGKYDLRAERGLILKSGIEVDGNDLGIGTVSEGAPLDVRKPFEREGVGPAIVVTGAPATAHLALQPAGAPAASPGASGATASAAPTGSGPIPPPPR